MSFRVIARLFLGITLGFIIAMTVYQSSRVGNINLSRLKGEVEEPVNNCGKVDRFTYPPDYICPSGMIEDGDWCFPDTTVACTCPSMIIRTCTGYGVCGCEEFSSSSLSISFSSFISTPSSNSSSNSFNSSSSSDGSFSSMSSSSSTINSSSSMSSSSSSDSSTSSNPSSATSQSSSSISSFFSSSLLSSSSSSGNRGCCVEGICS